MFLVQGCGNNKVEVENIPINKTAINSKWIGENYSLDLRGVCFHFPMTLKSMNLTCNGSYFDTNIVNGITIGNVDIQGGDSTGKLVFGNLAYINADDIRCSILTGNSYRYTVIENTLVLCDDSYNNCKFFTKE
jgi:hypothetical protein